jgi:hypothetical protein
MIRSGKFLSEPLEVARRILSNIDHNVEDAALSTAHQFAFLMRRSLVVHSANGANFSGERDIALHGKFMDAVLSEYFAAPGAGEESSFIA